MKQVEEQKKIDLLEYWRIIVKRKSVLFTFTGTIILLIGVYTFTTPPKFKAAATLLIGEETSKLLNIENEFGVVGYRSQTQNMIFLNTQLTLLKSESLATRVARKMELLSRPEFGAGVTEKKTIPRKIKDFLTLKWIKPKGKNQTEEVFIDPYLELAETLQKGINVSQIRDTRVLEISYISRYPVLTSEIVNKFAEEFIDFSIEKRYETTKQATDFLSEQIVELRQDLAAKENELQRYGQEKELFFLSDEENSAVKNLADLNAAYTQAQIDRANAESTYRGLRNANVDSLPRTGGNRVIQTLEEEYTRMKNEYMEKSKVYKPDYPDMIQLNSKIESMRQELQNEITKARNQAELLYKSALQNEYQLKDLLNRQRQDVAKLNSSAIFYNSLKIEVENKRQLLDSLVEKQNETLVSARLSGLKTSNINIIDMAKIPKTPVSPKKKLNLILALLIGILGGTSLCFVFDYFDNTLKTPEDTEKLTGLPSLGVIPHLSQREVKKNRYPYYSGFDKDYNTSLEEENENPPEVIDIELVNYFYPRLSIAEDYRTIRTSILLSHADKPPESIVFSSSLPSEGKTVTVANMAIAFAQLDKKVLIIDADLRKPRLHKIFKVKNNGGLSGYLTGKVSFRDTIERTEIKNIWLLPSGPIPPNPAELLNSKRMKTLISELKNGIDLVLLDTPPILAVVDSLIISSLTEAVAIIAEPGKTTRKSFSQAAALLQKSQTKIIGVIFNKADIAEKYYYPYHHYRLLEDQEQNSQT